MRIVAKAASAVCALTLATGVMAGCASGASVAANAEQQANRAYMSQVNQTMEELDSNLESFVDAVSRGDVVNMRSQADNAIKSLDKLDTLEVPENMADIQEGYVAGTDKLSEALDAYVALYTEASSADFDWSTYDSRIAAIQELYDAGVSALEAADEVAASKS